MSKLLTRNEYKQIRELISGGIKPGAIKDKTKRSYSLISKIRRSSTYKAFKGGKVVKIKKIRPIQANQPIYEEINNNMSRIADALERSWISKLFNK